MEAKLTGLPIISSDVGLIGYEVAADYVYPPGDSLALLNILSDLSLERFDRRMDVIEEVGDWKSYTAEVIGFIEGVKDAG
jgi:hypothetical protein